jgi:hypothetical protein
MACPLSGLPTLLAALLLAWAVPAPATVAQAPAALVSDRLFLGRSVPGGGRVGARAFDAFVRAEVTPRFPDGLTLWRAEGRWRERPGVIIDEGVSVLEVIHPDTPADNARMAAIAEAYRQRFRQQAVLRVTIRAEVRAPHQAGGSLEPVDRPAAGGAGDGAGPVAP